MPNLTLEEMKKRIFSLDVLATEYDDRNRPIGARKLPTRMAICMRRIRNEYASEIKMFDELHSANIAEYAVHEDGLPKTEKKGNGEVYLFANDEAREAFISTSKELLATTTEVKEYQVTMEDVLEIPLLEEWVLEAIWWMISPEDEPPKSSESI